MMFTPRVRFGRAAGADAPDPSSRKNMPITIPRNREISGTSAALLPLPCRANARKRFLDDTVATMVPRHVVIERGPRGEGAYKQESRPVFQVEHTALVTSVLAAD